MDSIIVGHKPTRTQPADTPASAWELHEQRKAAKRRNRAVMLVVAVAVLSWGLV